MANGQGYVSELKYPIMLAVALKVYLPQASNTMLALCALIGVLGLIALGYIDLKYIKLHQRTMEIQTEKYNPYFSRLFKKVSRRKI